MNVIEIEELLSELTSPKCLSYLMIADAYLSIHITRLRGEYWYNVQLYECFPAN